MSFIILIVFSYDCTGCALLIIYYKQSTELSSIPKLSRDEMPTMQRHHIFQIIPNTFLLTNIVSLKGISQYITRLN